MKSMSRLWWLILLRGIILIVLAFFVFRHPISALVGIAVYIGISLLFTGITQILVSVFSRNSIDNWGWGLAGGLIEILFAIILLSNPAITAATLPFILGFWIIVFGVMTFANAFQDRKSGMSKWWLGLISGLLMVLVGFLISNNLLVGSLAITIWIGIAFLIAGIANISAALSLKSLRKN